MIRRLQDTAARARRFNWHYAKDFFNLEEELSNHMFGGLEEAIHKLADEALGVSHTSNIAAGGDLSENLLNKPQFIRINFNRKEE